MMGLRQTAMIFKGLLSDARTIRDRDPAARTTLEVFLLYQGFHALIYHRQAHWLYEHNTFSLPAHFHSLRGI